MEKRNRIIIRDEIAIDSLGEWADAEAVAEHVRGYFYCEREMECWHIDPEADCDITIDIVSTRTKAPFALYEVDFLNNACRESRESWDISRKLLDNSFLWERWHRKHSHQFD